MICGRRDIIALEVFDPEMVGGERLRLQNAGQPRRQKISYIAKNTNANTITHYVPERAKGLDRCIEEISHNFPAAKITTRKVAIIAVIGSNMKLPGFLYRQPRRWPRRRSTSSPSTSACGRSTCSS